MTLKELKIQRALGTAEDMYSLVPGFFGNIKIGNNLIDIPYWLACKIDKLHKKGLSVHDCILDYAESQIQ